MSATNRSCRAAGPSRAGDQPTRGDPANRRIPTESAIEAVITQVKPPPANARCSVPGCVFPASDPSGGWCSYHVAQDEEAEFFESCQPILYVIAQYLLGPPDPEIEEYRRQQKRVQGVVRELFLRGVA